MITAAVIGYGRFGQLWADILSGQFQVRVYDLSFNSPSERHLQFTKLEVALSSELIFLCIPISEIAPFLEKNRDKIGNNSIVADTASVKMRPEEWMNRQIPNIPHIGLHPLFGPDSYRNNGEHRVILCPSEKYPELEKQFSDILEKLGLQVKILSAEEHDRSISASQGMTHLIGNILAEMNIESGETPTLGFTLLQKVEEFCSNDTGQLFQDMLTYNPFTRELVKNYSRSFQSVLKDIEKNALLERDIPDIGIMGVEGSFSNEACVNWLERKGISKYKIHFLVTAENVLSALDTGQIQLGFLALQNAAGGVVFETIEGLARHSRINIQEYHPFEVLQCLLKRKDHDSDQPASIHSHPQALKQCDRYLKTFYGYIPTKEEEDTALSARALSQGDLPRDVWVIAPESCAELYNLELVKKGIQDLDYNPTDFIVIGKV